MQPGFNGAVFFNADLTDLKPLLYSTSKVCLMNAPLLLHKGQIRRSVVGA